jgi:hypothetical protein
MPQRRLRLARGHVQAMRDARQPSARCHPPAAGYAIWKLEAALKCRSCRTHRYSPPVHMIKLTREREIAPYVWVHPDDDR